MVIFETFTTASDKVVKNLEPVYTNIATAIIIILVGFMIGKLIGILLDKLFFQIQLNEFFSRVLKRKFANLSRNLSDVVSFIIYAGSLIWALATMEILKFVLLALLYLAILIAIGALMLSLIDLLPNFISGIIIRNRNLIENGKKIRTTGVFGTVEKSGLLHTKIITKKGDVIFIPNQNIYKNLKK